MSIDSTDQVLLARVRAGDTAAFGELYAHHSTAAHRAARRIARDSHVADDLVSESFARVFKALRANNGPTGDLFPYLLVTMRNIAATWGRETSRWTPVGDDTAFAPRDARDLVSGADEAPVDTMAVSMTSKAFATLPSRWRTVLWYLEVEGESAAEVGRRLGLSDVAVRQLARRAREGLREAYLTAYIGGVVVQGAHIPPDDLAAMARGTISIRRRGQVEGHLDTCPHCAALLLEVAEENSTLRVLYLPLFVALGYAVVQWLQKQAGFLRPRGRLARGSSAVQPAVLAAVAVVAVTAIAAAVISGWFGGSSRSGDRGAGAGAGGSAGANSAGGSTGASGSGGPGSGGGGPTASAGGGAGPGGGARPGGGVGPGSSPTTIPPLPGGGGGGAGGIAIGGAAFGGIGGSGGTGVGSGPGADSGTTVFIPPTPTPVTAPPRTSAPPSSPPRTTPPVNPPSATTPVATTPVATPPVATPPVTTTPVTTPSATTPPVTVGLWVDVDATRTTSTGGVTTLTFHLANATTTETWRTSTVSFVLPAGVRLGHTYASCDERAGTVTCEITETLAPGETGPVHTIELRYRNGADHGAVTEPIDFTVTGVLVG
ncbi:MAG: sigma-70 family RNA polymerase sigma factor [bacterium]